jgi:hypothetical protein
MRLYYSPSKHNFYCYKKIFIYFCQICNILFMQLLTYRILNPHSNQRHIGDVCKCDRLQSKKMRRVDINED